MIEDPPTETRPEAGASQPDPPAAGGEPAPGTARSCLHCFAPVPAEARFCPFCGVSARGAPDDHAGTLSGPRLPPQIERRHLTVVFCDMVDSSRLASLLDPEDLTDLMLAFQRRVAEVVSSYGGVVARRLGDGALVFFGYPHAQEDDPEQAVRAALAVVEAIPRITVAGGQPLRVRVGAATGTAIVGDVAGTGSLGELDVAGEIPNLAARLQAIADPNTVVVSDGLRALASDLFLWRDLGRRALKGWSEPVRAWAVLGPTKLASRSELRHRAAPHAGMIGRQDQAERLDSLWQAARQGEGRVVLLRGEPGIGKSQLIAHLLQRATADRHTRLQWFCSPHQREAPLHPFLQHLERFVGFTDQDGPEERRTKLRAALPAMPEEDLALVAGLLMVPMPDHTARLAQIAPQRRREQTFAALHDSFLRLVRVGPVLAVFEDAHWADPTSAALLSLTVRRMAELPVLFLITARPDFRPDWAAAPGVETIELGPLDPAASAELVRQTAGRPAALARDVVAEIVRRSDGVPLFLEELTKAVLEAGGQDRRPAGVPPSIQASLLARIDRLGPAREVAQVAAVIGRDFDPDLLGTVAGIDPASLAEAMAKLLTSGLVVATGEAAPGGQYRFKHALIRDAAYETSVRARRRELHARVARALAAQLADGAVQKPQLLAHHYTEAGLAAEAAAWWLQAGRQSLQQSATTEALAQLRRGLTLIPAMPEGDARAGLELDLCIATAKCLCATAGWAAEETGESFARARALCDMLGARPQLRAVLFGQWTRSFLRAELTAALALSEEMLAHGASPQDGNDWLVVGHYTMAMTHHSLGDFDRVRSHIERGLALFDPARRDIYAGPVIGDPRVVMRTYLAWTLLCVGDFEAAARESARALAEARVGREAISLAQAVWHNAYLAVFTASPAAALGRLDELWPIVTEHGMPYYHALGTILRGWCVGVLGDPAAGLAMLREGLDGHRRTGSLLYLPGFMRMEAELLSHTGAVEEGLARVEEAEQLMRRTGEAWDDAEIAHVRGMLLARRGDPAAEAVLRQALARAEARGAVWFALRSAVSLARHLAATGREDDAVAVLGPLAARLGSEAHSVDLREAQALLAALRPAVAARS